MAVCCPCRTLKLFTVDIIRLMQSVFKIGVLQDTAVRFQVRLVRKQKVAGACKPWLLPVPRRPSTDETLAVSKHGSEHCDLEWIKAPSCLSAKDL